MTQCTAASAAPFALLAGSASSIVRAKSSAFRRYATAPDRGTRRDCDSDIRDDPNWSLFSAERHH